MINDSGEKEELSYIELRIVSMKYTPGGRDSKKEKNEDVS